ncbi:MAG: hypothetical protein U9Q98_13005 [Bacteroidota bacterium]|nr:hypothetical protein [Bacteroidota bacterium]
MTQPENIIYKFFGFFRNSSVKTALAAARDRELTLIIEHNYIDFTLIFQHFILIFPLILRQIILLLIDI